ncbi:protein FAM53B isoform X1 [Anguilla rostrata]|uniref:protein FAM53B isoform X1 n=2 Tax=Anguilla rostrata TaxID=7938 RepID=UPI0030CD9A72
MAPARPVSRDQRRPVRRLRRARKRSANGNPDARPACSRRDTSKDAFHWPLPALEWTGAKTCVTMVIIHTKTLEKKKGVDDVTSIESDLELRGRPTMMSQGTALFSCGVMGADRWRDLGRSCAIQRAPVGTSLESLWDGVAEACPGGGGWARETTGTPGAVSITSLIRDLSLSEVKAGPSASTAPPSKRQCRSLSCSDDPGGCRSSWRPQSSRVWMSVEKRRCHSGGSVQRGGGGSGGGAGGAGAFPAMQRSSSFSLPARSNALPLGFELPCFTFTSLQPSPPRPLYLSHEQICLPEEWGPSGASSPDSTPELGRRAGPGGLARSRSQPCVLNDKKIGMKRRRPDDSQQARPSLDLAKMTQKLRNFHSLSCPGITGGDSCQSSHTPASFSSTGQCLSGFASACDPEPPRRCSGAGGVGGEDPPSEELDSDSAASGDSAPGNAEETETHWGGTHRNGKDVYQLGGELDIEQIERN